MWDSRGKVRNPPVEAVREELSGREKVRVGMDLGVKRCEIRGREEERSRMCVAPESEISGEEREVRSVVWGKFGQRLTGWVTALKNLTVGRGSFGES